MVLVAIAMVAIIAMAAMAIDLVTLFLAREEAQRSADAAALTAAKIISLSGITGTASPGGANTTYWASICGTSGVATLAAQSAAGQNSVASLALPSTNVNVTYSAGSGAQVNSGSDCSAFNAAFAVNPLVSVTVQRTNLPTFFSRIWGNTGNSVSATATAEAFNPSASDVNGNGGGSDAVTPVQPRCVKPWLVPNQDPWNPSSTLCVGGNSGTCQPFVSLADGTIQHPGITLGGGGANGVIGETFNLFTDCSATGGPCHPPTNPPQANVPITAGGFAGGTAPNPPNLEYVPALVSGASVAVPACGTSVHDYEPAVAGCDQSTQYQCGVQSSNSGPNFVDPSENPGGPNGDTANGLVCALTGQAGSVPLTGPDVLDTSANTGYPFQMSAGAANVLKIPSGTQITASNQIVSLPIYDNIQAGTFGNGNQPIPVTIVGFLQVFINSIDASGNINVTVLNVAGCGNGSSGTPNAAVTGSSPVPVRLITPP